MKLSKILLPASVVDAQIDFSTAINTDAASAWTLDNARFAVKGGSITGHLAKLTDRYGFDGFGDAIATVADADFIAAIQGWSGTTENRLTNSNYFTADFYGATLLTNLVDQTIIDNIETSVLTPIATQYTSQGNDLTALMDTVRSSGFDPLIAAADLYNVDDYATSVAVMDALDAGFEAYSNIGLTPSTISNLVYNLNLDYFGKYIFAIEELASLQEDVMSALAFIPSEIQSVFITNLGPVCSQNMGPFTYLRNISMGIEDVLGTVFNLIGPKIDAIVMAILRPIFGDIEAVYNPFNFSSISAQLTGFEEWWEIAEVEAHTAAIFFDALLTPAFYNLISGPVCGIN